nr:hypothetical protein [Streptomyces sp. NRRL F-5755]
MLHARRRQQGVRAAGGGHRGDRHRVPAQGAHQPQAVRPDRHTVVLHVRGEELVFLGDERPDGTAFRCPGTFVLRRWNAPRGQERLDAFGAGASLEEPPEVPVRVEGPGGVPREVVGLPEEGVEGSLPGCGMDARGVRDHTLDADDQRVVPGERRKAGLDRNGRLTDASTGGRSVGECGPVLLG